MLLCVPPTIDESCSLAVQIQERRSELRAAAQAAVRTFAPVLGRMVQYGGSADIKTYAVGAIKQAGKNYHGAVAQQLKFVCPPLICAVKDIDLRVKYAGERALKYLCEGRTSAEIAAGVLPSQGSALMQYLGSTDRETAQFLNEFIKRTIPRLSVDSDAD